MNKLTVKAATGVRVPCEDNPRKYITDETGVTVDATAYYLRQLQAGDLVRDAGELQPTGSEVQPQQEPASPLAANVKKNKEVTDGQS